MSVFSKYYKDKVDEIKAKLEKREFENNSFLANMFSIYMLTTFKWSGDIPQFIQTMPQYIEESLFYSPTIAYFTDKDEHYIAPCFGNGALLENGLYSQYSMIMRNGKMFIKTIEEIEICFNNSLELPSIMLISDIVSKCTTALNAVDTALLKATMPILANVCEESDVNKILNALNEALKSNKPISLFSSLNWSEKSLTTTSIFDNKKDEVHELWDVFTRYKNLGLTYIGIKNTEISKTERLTSAESTSNDEAYRFGLLSDMTFMRENWCQRVKDHFGIDLKFEVSRNTENVSEVKLEEKEKIENATQSD